MTEFSFFCMNFCSFKCKGQGFDSLNCILWFLFLGASYRTTMARLSLSIMICGIALAVLMPGKHKNIYKSQLKHDSYLRKTLRFTQTVYITDGVNYIMLVSCKGEKRSICRNVLLKKVTLFKCTYGVMQDSAISLALTHTV